MYYYCTVCSNLHNEENIPGKVFEKGFYIEPGTGARIHLGTCDICDMEGKGENIQQSTECNIHNLNIANWLAVHDYINSYCLPKYE